MIFPDFPLLLRSLNNSGLKVLADRIEDSPEPGDQEKINQCWDFYHNKLLRVRIVRGITWEEAKIKLLREKNFIRSLSLMTFENTGYRSLCFFIARKFGHWQIEEPEMKNPCAEITMNYDEVVSAHNVRNKRAIIEDYDISDETLKNINALPDEI